MAKYSNLRAMRALTKASLQSLFKSPSAIVFSIAFPMVFILVFGFLGGGSNVNLKLAPALGSDTTNELYHVLKDSKAFSWISLKDSADMEKKLSDGDVTAIIDVRENKSGIGERYSILLQTSSAEADKIPQLQGMLNNIVQQLDPEIEQRIKKLADVEVVVSSVREFKTIDFILPGQLGFSLLAGSIFGTAFVFFNLRQTLVLKRFFATPVRREAIIVSEGVARMIFQLIGAMIIIVVGYFAFDFTLIHGGWTFFYMILLSALAIMVFMGFGFIISGVAKSESTIPPLSNLITLPQFLLAGTFFPIEVFPNWLQPICRIMPLTYLNSALRKVAFEGVGIWDIKVELLVLLAWGVIVYIVAGKVFRWE